MSRLRLLLFCSLLAVALAVAAKLLWPVSDEDQVRAAVDSVIDGARAGDIGAVVRPISDAYADDDGMSKDAIRGLVFREFQRRGAIGIQRGPMTVAVDGSEATARFDALLVEGEAGSMLPVDGDALSFTVTLRKEVDTWRIIRHTRQGIEEGWRLPEAAD